MIPAKASNSCRPDPSKATVYNNRLGGRSLQIRRQVRKQLESKSVPIRNVDISNGHRESLATENKAVIAGPEGFGISALIDMGDDYVFEKRVDSAARYPREGREDLETVVSERSSSGEVH